MIRRPYGRENSTICKDELSCSNLRNDVIKKYERFVACVDSSQMHARCWSTVRYKSFTETFILVKICFKQDS